MTKNYLLQSLLKRLKTQKPTLIYGFGSFFENRNRNDSDIDIAYLSPKKISAVKNYDLAQELASDWNKDVDLINLQDASTVMRIQVIKKGHILFCSDKKVKQEFEMYALSDYARLNEERKPILDRIKKEGTVYG
ncbi:MAG: type VII toxin-antitoxin system MntA family adenylyltransferase antitoxin [Elusimicrobiota bacterium]